MTELTSTQLGFAAHSELASRHVESASRHIESASRHIESASRHIEIASRHIEIAVRLAPPRERAKRTAEALRPTLIANACARLAAIDQDGGRTVLVVAVDFGEASEIASGTGQARIGLAVLTELLERFRDCDPAFVAVPDAA